MKLKALIISDNKPSSIHYPHHLTTDRSSLYLADDASNTGENVNTVVISVVSSWWHQNGLQLWQPGIMLSQFGHLAC